MTEDGQLPEKWSTDGELKNAWIQRTVARSNISQAILDVSDELEPKLVSLLTELGQNYSDTMKNAGMQMQKNTALHTLTQQTTHMGWMTVLAVLATEEALFLQTQSLHSKRFATLQEACQELPALSLLCS
eukprot:6484068-Amphidinium_carterae.1